MTSPAPLPPSIDTAEAERFPIEVRGLVSSFGDNLVHDGLDLKVERGEVLGVVGGSGTGKSVLLNTIIGLKAPDGGTVRISLQLHRRTVDLRVQDSGPGIPDYAESKVFEKFYSLARPHSRKKSTGLGLSFVSEIAELHEGRITLKNAAAGGALATLSLPLNP